MNNLKRVREMRGLSQSQLAKAADISVRTLQAYERNGADIDYAALVTVLRLANALRCDVRDIMNHPEAAL